MTDDEIDRLTIDEVRAIAARASEAMKTLRELGLAPSTPMRASLSAVAPSSATPYPCSMCGQPVVTEDKAAAVAPSSATPYPCSMCGRTGPVTPTEQANIRDGAPECGACGNPMAPAGARMTNKGPIVLSAAEKAWKLSQPAFDVDGEPT